VESRNLKMKPHVSVIIPYYDGAAWLPKSVKSVLEQQKVILELIIVDDGSLVSPKQIVDSFNDSRIILITKKHSGKGATVNLGVKNAKADIICILDQDDIMMPNRLKTQLDFINKSKNADVVYSDYEWVSKDGQLIDRFIGKQATNHEMLRSLSKGASLISMQTMLIRKNSYLKIGGFSEDIKLTGLDDAEFFVRLLISDQKLVYCPCIATWWVEHENNYSKSVQFQEARLVFLKYLSELSHIYPLKKEVSFFKTHNYFMRGIFFLNDKNPKQAVKEFAKAIYAYFFNFNTYYLFFKSIIKLIRPIQKKI